MKPNKENPKSILCKFSQKQQIRIEISPKVQDAPAIGVPRVLQSETVLSSTLQWANPSDPPSSLAAETGGRRRTATQIFSIGFQILNSNGGKISGENGRIVCLYRYDLGPLFGPISSKRRQRSNKPWPNINRMGHLDDLVIRPMARGC